MNTIHTHDEVAPATTADAVVVGVAKSAGSKSAVDYAASLANQHGRPLILANAVDGTWPQLEGLSHEDKRQQAWLDRVREDATGTHPALEVHIDNRLGPVASVLVSSTHGQHELVVGRRGLGAIGRVVLGSNSIRAAERASVPVVVVPEGWQVDAHAGEPMVLAIDPGRTDDGVIRYAFERANTANVKLIVVHAHDLSPLLSTTAEADAAGFSQWGDSSEEDLRNTIEPFTQRYPTVDVEVVRDRGHAAGVVLYRARGAQLVVVGRRHSHPGVLGLGSVAREVLHRATLPVAVVPRVG